MAVESKFIVGETVQLNSGSPLLTVSRINLSTTADWVEIMWYKDGTFKVESILAALLTKSDTGGFI